MGRQRTRRDEAEVDARERTCARCGRRMPSTATAEQRWCSARCRSARLSAVDRRLEEELLRRLAALSAGSTLCPSEIARAIGGGSGDGPDDGNSSDPEAPVDDENWRSLMEPTRQAARRLVASGQAEITQRGVVVDPSTARGPIRVRPVR